MGLTYFRRFRMEFDLSEPFPEAPATPRGYELVPFSEDLLREHATAKYYSFRNELDADVFPCLGRRDGCLRLMREISSRAAFVPEATWLLRFTGETRAPAGVTAGATETLVSTSVPRPRPVGTIQGMQSEGWGAVQNLGIEPGHRGLGLGTILLAHAARGFRRAGLTRMHLEVTTDNTAAVRLYERLGFRRAKVVYKAAEIAGA